MKHRCEVPKGFRTPAEILSVSPSEPVLIGYSGGVDSTALLFAMLAVRERYGTPIAAVHVNHNLRGDAALSDETHCREICKTHGIPFFSESRQVLEEQLPGESLETAARRVRYDCFHRVMQQEGYRILALAHHAGDNLETLLFRIGRGSGLRGLCGIPLHRPIEGGELVRPLLGVGKAELEAYCRRLGISHVEDQTNGDLSIPRNRIRAEVIPALRIATGNPEAAAFRLTESLAEDNDCLTALAAEFLASRHNPKDETGKPTALCRSELCALHPAIATRAILLFLENFGCKPETVHIRKILTLGKEGATHAALELPGGYLAKFRYDLLTVVAEKPADVSSPPAGEVPLSLGETVRFGDWIVKLTCLPEDGEAAGTPEKFCSPKNIYNLSIVLRLKPDTIKRKLFLRTVQPSDKILSRGMHKKVRTLLSDRHILPELRQTLPLLCDSEGILWVPFADWRDGVAFPAGVPAIAGQYWCKVIYAPET